jgi:predicted nuclease with TOPRIM domain
MTLTEQWKKGELEQGYYYTKYNPKVGEPFVEIELRNYLIDLAKVRDADTVEVLAPVPSYEEWQGLKEDCRVLKEALTNHKEIRNGLYSECDNLEKENQRLKELLKECRVYVENCEQFNAYDFEMLKTIDNAIGEKK